MADIKAIPIKRGVWFVQRTGDTVAGVRRIECHSRDEANKAITSLKQEEARAVALAKIAARFGPATTPSKGEGQ